MRYMTVADQPVAEQFAYWRDVICQVCTPLAAEREPERRRDGLIGWVRAAEIGSSHVAEVSSGAQSLAHGPAEIRRMASDDVFVSLQLQGSCLAQQGARTCHIEPGGFAMFDTTDAYRLTYAGEWQVLSFRVPRSRLLPLVGYPGGFTAVAHDGNGGGIAAMVTSTMTSIWQNVESLDKLAAQSAETALVTLLAAAAGDTGVQRERRRDVLDAALRASVNRYVSANLRHLDLAAAPVAGHFGISVRKLHGLYEETERTFAQTVMGMRVESCARDLLAGAGGRSLTDLASRWGFADLSHLNRVFRARYGCLPSEYRRIACADF